MMNDTFEAHGIHGVKPGKPGEQYLLCPKCSTQRRKSKVKSLTVNYHKGAWRCHHCGFSGFLNQDSPREFKPNIAVYMPVPYIPPKPPGFELTERHIQWFTEERGIKIETLNYFQIKSEKVFLYEKGDYKAGTYRAIAFQYFRNQELTNIKFRGSGKRFTLSSGAELIAYNQDCLLNKPTRVAIVEGELDVLAVFQSGFPDVISPPNGANLNRNNLEWLDKIYDEIDCCEEIIIAVDKDDAGESLKNDLVRRFDSEKIKIVNWPEGTKDANDVLLTYGEEYLLQLINHSEPIPIEGIFGEDKLAELTNSIYENGLPKGVDLGWSEFDKLCKWLRGEFVALTGIPSHGKSVWWENVMGLLSRRHGWKFGVWVAESDPEITVINLVQQIAQKPIFGPNKMSREEYQSAMAFVLNHFKFFDVSENEDNTLSGILSKGGELVRRYGIDCLYIDPWSYVEKDRGNLSDANFFESCLPLIKSFRRRYNCMVTVVAHPTKLKPDMKTGKLPVPTAYDISGSGQWYGAPDKVFSIYCHFNEDKTIDHHELHIQKQKKWWLGEKGIVDFSMNKLGIFKESNGVYTENIQANKFDYKSLQANDDRKPEDNDDRFEEYGPGDAPF